MASIYNVDEEEAGDGERQKLPSVEHDLRRAKKYLLKHSPESGDCLYDHLAELLDRILAERPRNAVDAFEDYSRRIKDERFRSKTNYLRDVRAPSARHEDAKKFLKLHQALKDDGENEADDGPEEEEKSDDSRRTPPDIMELFFYLEQIDVALPRSEIVALNLSIRKLVADKPIENVRFWGKIVGRPRNYYVVEAELQPQELLARGSAEAEAAETSSKALQDEPEEPPGEVDKATLEARANEADGDTRQDESSDKLRLIFPPLPRNPWKAPPVVPAEAPGTGLNGKIYLVCNTPGLDDWTELPAVTPQQIVAARQIVRLFTGDPEAPILTFPPFPGTERNYLRAQIARISAATLVSPVGFFTFGKSLDEEDEDEADTELAGEEDEGSPAISENRHYEPLPTKELIDPSMSNWCHHSAHILPQGRAVWWNPAKESARGIDDDTEAGDEEDEEDEEDDDEDEERENSDEEFRREVGPPLLTPLSEDAGLESIGAWTARASSTIKSDRAAIAIVRSNIWPGSYAFARGKRFANVYIGTGQKFNPYNYSPPGMPMIQEQCKIGPEITEAQDPSPEAEEAYRVAHLPAGKPLELGGEQGESTEEEDDEDVDDDDDDDDDE